MDSFTRLEGRIGADQFSTVWKARRFVGVIAKGRLMVRWSTRKCCRGFWRMRACGRGEAFLFTGYIVSVGADQGPCRKLKERKE
jgi:hypothetical protein